MVSIDIGLILKKDGKPGRIYNITRQEYHDDIVDMLEQFITESKKHDMFIAWDGLKYQKLTVINILHKMGYIWTDNSKRDMHVKEMRGRIAANKVFYLQIKTAGRSYITIQGVDQIIGQKKPAQDVQELAEYMELYHYTRSRVTTSGNRILYSASSISRTLFNRSSTTYKMSASYYNYDMYYNGRERKTASLFLENYFRSAVHGGYNAMSGNALGYDGPAIVLDVNSLYPYIASTAVLPTLGLVEAGDGAPDRRYIRHKDSYYTFMQVEVSATIKADGIPCIIANGSDFFSPAPLTTMDRRIITLSEADRQLLYDNYDITYYRIKSHVIFKASTRDFADYLKPMYESKKKAHGAERGFYKLVMNGLIGNFAKHAYVDEYVIKEDKDGNYNIVKQPKNQWEYLASLSKVQGLLYINIAIVSEARRYIVGYIRKHADRWLYTDTDSIHLMGTDIPDDIPVSDEMGDFKPEHIYTRVCYYGLKKYIGYTDSGDLLPTIAGLPKDTLTPVHKMRGIDTAYINKCIRHHKIEQLAKKPIAVYSVVEDLASLTVSVEWNKGWLMEEQPTKAQYHAIDRRREEQYEQWYEEHHDTLKDMLRTSHDKRVRANTVRDFADAVQRRGWEAIPARIMADYRTEVAETLADRGVFFV